MPKTDVHLDRHGRPYVTDPVLGPWLVTTCCYAFAKGSIDSETGVVCRACYRDLHDFTDGPAEV